MRSWVYPCDIIKGPKEDELPAQPSALVAQERRDERIPRTGAPGGLPGCLGQVLRELDPGVPGRLLWFKLRALGFFGVLQRNSAW